MPLNAGPDCSLRVALYWLMISIAPLVGFDFDLQRARQLAAT